MSGFTVLGSRASKQPFPQLPPTFAVGCFVRVRRELSVAQVERITLLL